jgi:hypothetical protein
MHFKFDLWKNNELIGVLLRAERGLTKQLPFSKLITLDCNILSVLSFPPCISPVISPTHHMANAEVDFNMFPDTIS